MSSTSDVREQTSETVLVGRVVRSHGIRGEVKVEVTSDVSDRFTVGATLLVSRPGGQTETARVASFRFQPKGALLRLEGCEDREGADALRGARLEVPLDDVPPAPAGAYYHFDLIGCRCSDEAAGFLGTVAAVMDDGGGQILRVERDEHVTLVPFVAAFILSIDIAERQIALRLPEGLVEACTSAS